MAMSKYLVERDLPNASNDRVAGEQYCGRQMLLHVLSQQRGNRSHACRDNRNSGDKDYESAKDVWPEDGLSSHRGYIDCAGGHWLMYQPPLGEMTCPVMNLASSLAR
jgi:hypothetical protein